MAVLTAAALAEMRQQNGQGVPNVRWVKPEINAALQAIEDSFENQGRAQMDGAINAATAPFIFDAAEKNRLIAYWLRQKATREGV